MFGKRETLKIEKKVSFAKNKIWCVPRERNVVNLERELKEFNLKFIEYIQYAWDTKMFLLLSHIFFVRGRGTCRSDEIIQIKAVYVIGFWVVPGRVWLHTKSIHCHEKKTKLIYQ